MFHKNKSSSDFTQPKRMRNQSEKGRRSASFQESDQIQGRGFEQYRDESQYDGQNRESQNFQNLRDKNDYQSGSSRGFYERDLGSDFSRPQGRDLGQRPERN